MLSEPAPPPVPLDIPTLLAQCRQAPHIHPAAIFKKMTEQLFIQSPEQCAPYWDCLRTLLQHYPTRIDLSYLDHLLTRMTLEQSKFTILELLCNLAQFNIAYALKYAFEKGLKNSFAYLVNHKKTSIELIMLFYIKKMCLIQQQKHNLDAKQHLCAPYWKIIKTLLDLHSERINLNFNEQPLLTFPEQKHVSLLEKLLQLAIMQNYIENLEWLLEHPQIDLLSVLQYALDQSDDCLFYLFSHPKLDLKSAAEFLKKTPPHHRANTIFRKALSAYNFQWTTEQMLLLPEGITSLEAEIINLEYIIKDIEREGVDICIMTYIQEYFDTKLQHHFFNVYQKDPKRAHDIYASFKALHYPEALCFYSFKNKIWRRSKNALRLQQEKMAITTLENFFLQAFGIENTQLSEADKTAKLTAHILKNMRTPQEIKEAALYLKKMRCPFVSSTLLKNCAAILALSNCAPPIHLQTSCHPVQFSNTVASLSLGFLSEANKNAPSPQREEASFNTNQDNELTLQQYRY